MIQVLRYFILSRVIRFVINRLRGRRVQTTMRRREWIRD
jgi:hypothetical protein